MDEKRWRQVKELYTAAAELAPGERRLLLERECGGDAGLRREVERLLASPAETFLERPAVAEVADLIVEPAGELQRGQRVSHYEIVSQLGAGGMGEVYLARDTRLGREVALKVLPPHLTADEQRLSRFEREARAASRLNHPNIITIHEIGSAGVTHFIVTEYVEGETLRQRMVRSAPSVAEAVEIAAQLASALAVAHAAGVTHRDIKPENVMLRADGIVKLLDFGLAKLTEAEAAENLSDIPTRELTRPGVVMGTVNYMSPEQARGAQLDHRTDIWSLGVVLYEMLTGQPPFAGRTASHTLVAIMEDDPPPLTKERHDAPAELERVVARLLARERGRRYQTAREVLDDLRGLQKRLGGGPAAELASPGSAAVEQPRPASSIAILPFSTFGLKEDEEYLGLGLADALITQLSRARQLAVRPTSAVRHYTGARPDTVRIGRELNVGAILEGSLQRAGERLRVTVQLVGVETGNSLWANKFVFGFTDIFEMQDEIAAQVAGALLLRLSTGEQQRIAARATANVEAYQSYLKGRFYLYKVTPEGIRKAVSHFGQALALEPGYGSAHAGLAEAFVIGSYICFPPQEALPNAREAALRAIELDAGSAEARAALGVVRQLYDWDWQGAEAEFKLALQLNPNYAMAYRYYGGFLGWLRRFNEAVEAFREGLRLDPLSPLLKTYLAMTYYCDEKPDLAAEHCLSALEIEPDFPPALGCLGVSYLLKGDWVAAVATLQRQCSVSRTPIALANLAHAYGVAGQQAEAREILADLEGQARQEHVLPLYFALIHVGLNDRRRALIYLERAFAERNVLLPGWLNADPRFQVLRDDARVQDLLRRLHLL